MFAFTGRGLGMMVWLLATASTSYVLGVREKNPGITQSTSRLLFTVEKEEKRPIGSTRTLGTDATTLFTSRLRHICAMQVCIHTATLR